MPDFRCWSPWFGDLPEDGSTISAWDARGASEKYAKALCTDGDTTSAFSNGTGVEIHVRDNQGLVHRFDVTADWSPTFYAREKP